MTPRGDIERHDGRFAPSPTGALHFGSLLAALASFLQARSHRARWHLRIEDLDSQRQIPGAADAIQHTLERFGLHWDGPVLYQGTRRAAYETALETLAAAGRTFACGCTRREALTGPQGLEGRIYAGTCRNGLPPGREARSIRVRVDDVRIAFTDQVQGEYGQRLAHDVGDFVLRRSDGFFAYQLAVVVDDAHSGIGEVVRGADLLTSTPRQIYLQHLLGLPRPNYLHLPVLVDSRGNKLSKHEQAPALSLEQPSRALSRALHCLGQPLPAELADAPPDEILAWAIRHWTPGRIPARATLPLTTTTAFRP